MFRSNPISLFAVCLLGLHCLDSSVAVRRYIAHSEAALQPNQRIRVTLSGIESSVKTNLAVYLTANQKSRGYLVRAGAQKLADTCSFIVEQDIITDADFLDLAITVVRLGDFHGGQLFNTLPDCWNVEGEQDAAYRRLRGVITPVEIRLRIHQEGQRPFDSEMRIGQQVIEYGFVTRPLPPFWFTTNYLGKEPNLLWRMLWPISIPLEIAAAPFQWSAAFAHERITRAMSAKCPPAPTMAKQVLRWDYCELTPPSESIKIAYILERVPQTSETVPAAHIAGR